MRNVVIWLLCVGFIQCSNSATTNVSSLKFLAANVAMTSAQAAEMEAEGATVDTNTVVLASNVVLDNTETDLTSDNVQSAFAETFASLSDSLIGTWTVRQISNSGFSETVPDFYTDVGTITFNADNTFSVVSVSPETHASLNTILECAADYENIVMDYQTTNNTIVSLRYYGNSITNGGVIDGGIQAHVVTRLRTNEISLLYLGEPEIWTKVVSE